MRAIAQEKAELDKALNAFTEDCRARLHEMSDQGKRGWADPKYADDIAFDLHRDAMFANVHKERKHLHDIANRAMMLWWQTYGGSK